MADQGSNCKRFDLLGKKIGSTKKFTQRRSKKKTTKMREREEIPRRRSEKEDEKHLLFEPES